MAQRKSAGRNHVPDPLAVLSSWLEKTLTCREPQDGIVMPQHPKMIGRQRNIEN